VAWGLERISSHELSEWMAFAEMEPFGFEADFYGHAQTSATLANVNRSKDSKVYTAMDFMPVFKQIEEKEQSPDNMIHTIEMINIIAGGKDLRKHK